VEPLGSDLDRFVENDSITPGQYRDTHARADPYHAERRLWLKAFESHLDDLSGRRRGRHQLTALEWLADDSEGLLSFRWYCDVLNLDWSATRAALLKGEALPSVQAPDPNEYARQYRENHRGCLRDYHREYARRRRAAQPDAGRGV